MKIYNEVTSRFNDKTGKWETISEDSFELEPNGSNLALLQETNANDPFDPMATSSPGASISLPANATEILDEDSITDTIKTTAGYFTSGDGTMAGTDIYTSSLADGNEKYYFNVANGHPLSSSSEVQFSVTFGHIEGSGSNQYGDTTNNPKNLIGETQAIYKQFTSLLLPESEQSGGFKIASQGAKIGPDHNDGFAASTATTAGARDEYFYALIGKRNRFKDRMNKKAWTLTLSGSNSTAGVKGRVLQMCDDSKYVASVTTPAGPRFNIVSGTLGVPTGSDPSIAYAHRTLGWFYPEMGIMLFSGVQMSASIPGNPAATSMTASFIDKYSGATVTDAITGTQTSGSGLAPNLSSGKNNPNNPNNALKFVNTMKLNQGVTTLRLRSEEDQTQYNYFCRIKAGQYNFSNNPTFTSGSTNKIRQSTMIGNPTSYITGVGLYNGAGQLLATAKLSSPLKKNYASEATVKVKLTY